MIRSKERKNFDFDSRYVEIMTRLKDICALNTDTKVVEEALVFLAWAAGEAIKGRKVGSYDEGDKILHEITTPALQMASRWTPPPAARQEEERQKGPIAAASA